MLIADKQSFYQLTHRKKKEEKDIFVFWYIFNSLLKIEIINKQIDLKRSNKINK